MSWKKAEQLLSLAMKLRQSPMSVADIARLYEVDRRSADRMLAALDQLFPDRVIIEKGEDNKTKWRRFTRRGELSQLVSIRDGEILALQNAIKTAEGKLSRQDMDSLKALLDKLKTALDDKSLRKLEPDLEALMEAEGVAFRPGPRFKLAEDVIPAVREAILATKKLRIIYVKVGESRGVTRLVHPYGVLYGQMPYLLAKVDGKEDLRMWRMDGIKKAGVETEQFAKEEFSLAKYGAGNFGLFSEEPFEVEWEFSGEAADSAAKYTFYPTQSIRRLGDGKLRVSFTAGGALEMYWHLVQWGGDVKVIKPKDFKRRVERHLSAGFFRF